MPEAKKIYVAIDLKSFYASVECVERGLDSMDTNLVVADSSRTEKTICLAVSPSLKAYGIPGRPRLFEVIQKVREANAHRQCLAPGRKLVGSSCSAAQLSASPELSVDYITAPPRMSLYLEYSTKIYDIYLRHVAPEDIHVYSIDEVFLDVTQYLEASRLTAREFAERMIKEVLQDTGIVATAGIGTNLYLCKVAMDIVAKHVEPNQDGVRIALLDETAYRSLLWGHRPLTDFWRVGRGYAKKLEENGLYTMGDIARCSLGGPSDYHNEELLYRLFGVNAELLIDHAWGYEPCTIADVKSYRPQASSMGAGSDRAFLGQTATQRIQVMHFSGSVVSGRSVGIAPTGHRLAHRPHLIQAFPALGWAGIPPNSRYGILPGTWTADGRSSLDSFSATCAPNSRAVPRSSSSGRPAAMERTMECSAMKAAAAITRKPISSMVFFSSKRASSNSRFP